MKKIVHLLGGAGLVVLGLIPLAHPAAAQKFRPDDPLTRDHDDLAIPKPQPIELSTVYDVLEHTFGHRPEGKVPSAQNVNTLGEVPDSSWFTNRMGAHSLSLEELARGPNQGEGPDVSRPLTIISGKSGGITPGFTIRDARGDVYFIKFDPPSYPNLSTAADVLVARFFHAFGYNVPENYVAYLRRENLQIAEQARVSVRGGKKRKMTTADLEGILGRVYKRPDGSIRVVASRRLSGEPLGPFKYYGTRGDDPNDVLPHEHRRELRGMRVFAAWLNHDDSRSINSQDMYVTEGGRGFVKHHLLDFSSCLGSGSNARKEIAPQNPRAGNEYTLDWGPLLKSAFSLGLWDRPWRDVKYPSYPEIGNFEAEFFRPERWKGEYPNPAFERMQNEDAFWAARIVAQFSDEAIRAIVHTGGYDDPEAERYLAATLIKRRDKVVAHYFRQLNPLAEFRIAGSPAAALEFENLGEQAGLGKAEAYEYQWFAFDNRSEKLETLGASAESAAASVLLPSGGHDYVMVRLRTRSPSEPHWQKKVDVYIRRADGPKVVGIEREN